MVTKLLTPKVNIFLYILFTIPLISFSQTTIWEENFTYPNGTTAGTANRWITTVNSSNGTPDDFNVVNNRFEADYLRNRQQVFETENIDISSYTNVSISLDIDRSRDPFESTDYIRAYYSINGGTEILFSGDLTGNFTAPRVASATGLNGATIKISIRMLNTASDEIYYVDNILVEGTLAVSSPEIDVLGNGVFIANNDSSPDLIDDTDYGTQNVSISKNRTFTIQNSGTSNLTIVDISSSGTVFTISGFTPSTVITAGNATTFIVTGTPTGIGDFTETITINNNDSDEGIYQFDVKIIGEENFFDSDGDGILDNIDIDDDNDGIRDEDEETACKISSLSIAANYKFLNETFGAGGRTTINTTYAFASTNYCYEDGFGGCFGTGDLNDGEYTVYYKAANGDGTDQTPIGEVASWADDFWYTGEDHTPDDSNGRMAMFNAIDDLSTNFTPGIFYTAAIKGALPNIPITYSFWAINLDTEDAPDIANRERPNVLVEFRDVNDNVLASIATGDLPPSINGNPAASWHQYTADLTLNVDEFYVYFINNHNGGLGNDLALDDIVISQTLCDLDNDGVADVFDLDSDNDGIPDVVEAGLGNLSAGTARIPTDGSWVDTNLNGMHDSAEANIPLDSDGDGIPNYLDLDSDNDSIFDVDESGAGNTADLNYQNGDGDINGDGVGDGLDTDAFRETDVNSDDILEYFTDGILDIYDYFNGVSFNTGYGNSNQGATGLGWHYYVLDTDNDGIPDYLDNTSDGVTYDISHTLYASLDADTNGIIDGNTDTDGDGILDAFDTNNAVFGSPRDLNRKLHLYFDGRNDYGEDTNVISSGEATLMAFIKSDGVNTNGNDRILVGQNDFYVRINNGSNTVSVVVEGTVITSSTPITDGIWTHVAATTKSGETVLYINGVAEGSATSGGIMDTSNLSIGRATGAGNYFKGYMDEVRVFDKALTANELQKMIYQEIEANGGNIRGLVIPRDITDYINTTTTPVALPWANLKRYFRMDAYKDDIIDDLTTATIDVGTGAKIYNMKIIDVQTAPLPFITQIGDTSLPNAVDISADGVLGTDVITYNWSIVKIEHKNITYNANQKHLGLIINNQDASSNPIEFSIQNNSELNISWYLELDGFLDLEGESQIVQGDDSMLDEDSGGYLERDQQGTANSFNYNYWSSSVGTISGNTATRGTGVPSINNTFSINNQLFDGRNSATPVAITDFNISPYYADNVPSGALKISSYWFWKFNGPNNDYNAWIKINENTQLNPAEGYTMKGSLGNVAITTQQNYVFRGKPYNGNITLPIIAGNDRLIGNPYPSAMDADEFIKDNIKETINGNVGRNTNNIFNGALYFWDHFGQENSHILREYVGGYATYTLMGGVSAISNDARINASLALGSKIPTRYIPVNQGFFVNTAIDVLSGTTTTIDGGAIIFKNSQRVFETEISGNSLFMKGVKEKNETAKKTTDSISDTRQKIRLLFHSPKGYYRQLLVGVDENTSNNFDIGFDASLADLGIEDMYWIIDDGKFVIQGVNNFNKDQELPLGLVISEAGLISINIEELENIESDFDIYIKDTFTGETHAINNNAFEIYLESGEYKDRFVLTFKSDGTLGVEEEILKNGIQIVINNNTSELKIINNIAKEIKSVDVFNMLGQQLKKWSGIFQDQNASLPINLSSGVYMVRVNTSDRTFSKKIIIY